MFRFAPHSVVGDHGKELRAAASAHGSLVRLSSRSNARLTLIRHRCYGVWAKTGNALRTFDITLRTAEHDDTDPKENPTSLSTCGLAHRILCFVASQPRAAFGL
jgi:hypothetical protein